MLPRGFAEDRELISGAAHELMPRDLVCDQVFEGGVDVTQGDVVGMAQGSETWEDVGGDTRAEISRHGVVVVRT